jgi:hypothetical protein
MQSFKLPIFTGKLTPQLLIGQLSPVCMPAEMLNRSENMTFASRTSKMSTSSCTWFSFKPIKPSELLSGLQIHHIQASGIELTVISKESQFMIVRREGKLGDRERTRQVRDDLVERSQID